MTLAANPPLGTVRSVVRRLRLDRLASLATWYVVVVMVAIMFATPLLTVLVGSLKSPVEAAESPPTYFPSAISFHNFIELVTSNIGVGQSIINSVVVSGATSALTTVLALLAAFGFQRFPFPASNVIFVLMLGVIMVPFQVLVTPLYVVLQAVHLTNSLAGLVLVLTTFQLPFAIFVVRTSFATIPTELYEAAAVDGAGMWRTLQMMLPLVRPGLITAALFAFFAAWNEFFAPLILLSDQTKFTLPVVLTTLVNGARGAIDWGLLQAGVVVTIAPCLIIFIVLQRYYVRGLIAGSGK